MTEELSPEFLKFSQMLDEEPESVEPEHAGDAELLQQLGEALRDEPASSLPGDFASQTAKGVMARFEALSPWGKRMLWLEARLLSPLNFTRALKSLPAFGALGALAYLAPHWLLPFGLLLFSMSALWGLQHWVARDVWGLGKDDFKTAFYQRLTLTLPLFAAATLVIGAGWNIGGVFHASLDTKTLTAATLLVALVPVLYWLGLGLKGALIEAKRPRVSFGLMQILSLVLIDLGLSYSVPAYWQYANVIVATNLVVFGLILTISKNYHNDYLRFEHRGFLLPALPSKLAFYFLPLTNAFGTGILVGGLVHYLGFLSVSFRSNMDALTPLAIFMAISVSFLAISASYRYWEAVLAEAKHRASAAVIFQGVQVLWLCGIVSLLLGGLPSHGHQYGGILAGTVFAAAVAALLAVVLSRQAHLSFTSKLSIAQARKRGLRSVLFGALPIVASAVVFYQLNLTRQIFDPSYTAVLRQVNDWAQKQKAIPAEQNGWTLLKPYMLRSNLVNPENEKFNKDLKSLSDYCQGNDDDYLTLIKEKKLDKYEADKKRFLSRLPVVEEALSRPHFSSISTQGLSMTSLVPDYIVSRAVTQGLALLTQESMAKKRPADALHYTLLALKWDTADQPGSLIGLMIRIAQLSITHSKLEGAVLNGVFDGDQLETLAQALDAARPEPGLFAETMMRETVMCDSSFDIILSGQGDPGEIADSEVMSAMIKILPRSYWESERKAYWNNQLMMADQWANLSFPAGEALEINPFNLASSFLVPNTYRANAQFCYIHSKLSALILECELERYKLDHGSYPKDLRQLVPAYLPKLPEDFMQPQALGMKPTFRYKKTDQGYLIKSTSRVYERVSVATEQVYGHDGLYSENR